MDPDDFTHARGRPAVGRTGRGKGDRHQKKDVEAALKRAEACGLKVTCSQNGHNWGGVIRCPCNDKVRVHRTPRNPGEEAKKIDVFIGKHHNCA
ncbi:hypothetical protein ACFYXL_22935 [Streptomyces tsukubensis]|uniref:hypothetical protein n=1 Tax=Streptomyces tsukubensis TaxID=83656 RepID=UPI00369F3FCE